MAIILQVIKTGWSEKCHVIKITFTSTHTMIFELLSTINHMTFWPPKSRRNNTLHIRKREKKIHFDETDRNVDLVCNIIFCTYYSKRKL